MLLKIILVYTYTKDWFQYNRCVYTKIIFFEYHMRQYMIFNWVAMITYSVKLLTLGKATRAPYKRSERMRAERIKFLL